MLFVSIILRFFTFSFYHASTKYMQFLYMYKSITHVSIHWNDLHDFYECHIIMTRVPVLYRFRFLSQMNTGLVNGTLGIQEITMYNGRPDSCPQSVRVSYPYPKALGISRYCLGVVLPRGLYSPTCSIAYSKAQNREGKVSTDREWHFQVFGTPGVGCQEREVEICGVKRKKERTR